MSTGDKSHSYVLIRKDDFSGDECLTSAKEAIAETVADTLISRFSAFGGVSQWVSDRGTHFKNELVKILSEQIRVEHHFTLAHCPWSNGTVDAVY